MPKDSSRAARVASTPVSDGGACPPEGRVASPADIASMTPYLRHRRQDLKMSNARGRRAPRGDGRRKSMKGKHSHLPNAGNKPLLGLAPGSRSAYNSDKFLWFIAHRLWVTVVAGNNRPGDLPECKSLKFTR